MVLDGVISPGGRNSRSHTDPVSSTEAARPPRQEFGDVGPAVSQHPLGLTDDEVFLSCPAALLHGGVQVVVPPLTDLLPVAAVQVFGDERPALGAKLLHQIDDLQREQAALVPSWYHLHILNDMSVRSEEAEAQVELVARVSVKRENPLKFGIPLLFLRKADLMVLKRRWFVNVFSPFLLLSYSLLSVWV